jgi:putative nucleotidyltransferase with HDIG domain
MGIVHALSEAVDAKSHLALCHSKKVTEYALSIAKSLKLEPAEIARVEVCALLHDIGKISISEKILNKSDGLTAEEAEELKNHPKAGAALVSKIPQLAMCTIGILHHHECWDGSGFPDGLKGEDIPLESRIIAVADAFTSMTCEDYQSKVRSIEEAMEELKQCSGRQYDPYLVGQFIASNLVNATSTPKKRGGKNSTG